MIPTSSYASDVAQLDRRALRRSLSVDKKDADVDRLTREEIERARRTRNVDDCLEALCDLALQSLSQEAVRDEDDTGLFAAGHMQGFTMGLEEAKRIALAIDSGRGNEKEIAKQIAKAIEALKREPNAAPTREESGQDWDAVLSAEPAPAAPDVAGMVKRLEGLPWPKLSYPDEAEMRDLGYAALPLLQELPALLARLGEGAPLSADYIQTVPDKCDRIIWRGRYYHLPLAPGASDE